MAVCSRVLIVLVLFGACSAVSVHYGPLPVFNVSGTHYEVAMAIVRMNTCACSCVFHQFMKEIMVCTVMCYA